MSRCTCETDPSITCIVHPTKQQELLPCPFCGSSDIDTIGPFHERGVVTCKQCRTDAYLAVWNTRADGVSGNADLWISVDDDMPTESGWYFVYYENGNTFCRELLVEKYIAPPEKVGQKHYSWLKQRPEFYGYITHWKPLPPPPMKEKISD